MLYAMIPKTGDLISALKYRDTEKGERGETPYTCSGACPDGDPCGRPAVACSMTTKNIVAPYFRCDPHRDGCDKVCWTWGLSKPGDTGHLVKKIPLGVPSRFKVNGLVGATAKPADQFRLRPDDRSPGRRTARGEADTSPRRQRHLIAGVLTELAEALFAGHLRDVEQIQLDPAVGFQPKAEALVRFGDPGWDEQTDGLRAYWGTIDEAHWVSHGRKLLFEESLDASIIIGDTASVYFDERHPDPVGMGVVAVGKIKVTQVAKRPYLKVTDSRNIAVVGIQSECVDY